MAKIYDYSESLYLNTMQCAREHGKISNIIHTMCRRNKIPMSNTEHLIHKQGTDKFYIINDNVPTKN